jgi:hypothetical protein
MGVRGRRGRRCKQLLDDLKETRRYWKMKEEVLDCTVRRTDFGRGYGSVVRQRDSRRNEYIFLVCQYCLTVAIMNDQNMLEYSSICG